MVDQSYMTGVEEGWDERGLNLNIFRCTIVVDILPKAYIL